MWWATEIRSDPVVVRPTTTFLFYLKDGNALKLGKKKMDQGHCFRPCTTRRWCWEVGAMGCTHTTRRCWVPVVVGYDGGGVRGERLTYLFVVEGLFGKDKECANAHGAIERRKTLDVGRGGGVLPR